MKHCIRISAIALAIVLGATAISGCDSDEPVATTSTTGEATALVPALAQITAAVSLDDDDTAVVAAALADWQESVTGQKSDAPFRGHRAGAEFLAAVAPSLDNAQLSDLVDFLGDYRDTNRKQARRAFHAGGGPGKWEDDLAESLGLDAEQKTALAAIHSETRRKMREQHDALRAGTISEEQLAAAVTALHAAQREKLALILTEAQLAKLDAYRDERRARMIDRRLERMDERADARAEWLAAVLNLDTAQRAEVAASLEASLAERKAALEAAQDGDRPLRAWRGERREHHDEMLAKLEAILTPEQQERLEIIRRLHPREPRND